MIGNAIFRKRTLVVCLTALVLGLAAGGANADPISVFSNFGPGGAFSTSHGYTVDGANYGNFAEAAPFVPGRAADLADAVLALGNTLGSNSPITLDLESSSSGLPSGTILATLTQQGTIPPLHSPGLVSFDYSGPSVELTPGTSYWLVAVQSDANSVDAWLVNTTGHIGAVTYNSSGSATGPWSTEPGQPIAAFEVDGTPTPVPEPPTLTLLAFGLLAVGVPLLSRNFTQVVDSAYKEAGVSGTMDPPAAGRHSVASGSDCGAYR
jgi:hypothetical protein